MNDQSELTAGFKVKARRQYHPPARLVPWSYVASDDELHGIRPVRVFVRQSTMDTIWSHASSDKVRELIGILLGRVSQDPVTKQYWIEVTKLVPGKPTTSTPTFVEVDAETMSALGVEVDKSIDESSNERLRRVGWYHTHPNLGIFMSGTDRSNQAVSYSADWQLALVVDPVRREYGFFHGKEARKVAADDIRVLPDERFFIEGIATLIPEPIASPLGVQSAEAPAQQVGQTLVLAISLAFAFFSGWLVALFAQRARKAG